MGNKVVLISGTDYNIDGIQELGNVNNNGKVIVTDFNKFGFIGIQVKNKGSKIKRHLSDCEDIRSLAIGEDFDNLIYKDGRWVVIHCGKELQSKDVFVIRSYIDSVPYYETRSKMYGDRSIDITKAWFTFEREQAIKYANRMSITHLKAFEAVNVEDVITLQRYE